MDLAREPSMRSSVGRGDWKPGPEGAVPAATHVPRNDAQMTRQNYLEFAYRYAFVSRFSRVQSCIAYVIERHWKVCRSKSKKQKLPSYYLLWTLVARVTHPLRTGDIHGSPTSQQCSLHMGQVLS